jgi:phosphoglycerate kinase
MNKLCIEDVPLSGKRVFVRVDFNVPLDDHGNIADDVRIRAALPTINHLVDENCRVVIASHFGRPKGERNMKYSLAPVRKRLERLLNKKVLFSDDCVGAKVKQMIHELGPGQVLLLENLRFNKGEKKNDREFARELADDCEVYVNDAFGAAHRTHASIDAITEFIPVAAAGYLMKKEIEYFDQVWADPVRPMAAILGGAKVSDKIGVIFNLIERVEKVLIGGGMMFTFLKAMGYEIGNSIVESDMQDVAREIMEKAREHGVKFYLPVDCVVADKVDPSAEIRIVPVQEIPEGWSGLDIGPATMRLFAQALQNARTILWNGPMGLFEMEKFSRGTRFMAHTVADSYALTIVGGGDTDVAVHKAGESANISYISTGGGAFLQLMEGKELPGLAALTDKQSAEAD